MVCKYMELYLGKMTQAFQRQFEQKTFTIKFFFKLKWKKKKLKLLKHLFLSLSLRV